MIHCLLGHCKQCDSPRMTHESRLNQLAQNNTSHQNNSRLATLCRKVQYTLIESVVNLRFAEHLDYHGHCCISVTAFVAQHCPHQRQSLPTPRQVSLCRILTARSWAASHPLWLYSMFADLLHGCSALCYASAKHTQSVSHKLAWAPTKAENAVMSHSTRDHQHGCNTQSEG